MRERGAALTGRTRSGAARTAATTDGARRHDREDSGCDADRQTQGHSEAPHRPHQAGGGPSGSWQLPPASPNQMSPSTGSLRKTPGVKTVVSAVKSTIDVTRPPTWWTVSVHGPEYTTTNRYSSSAGSRLRAKYALPSSAHCEELRAQRIEIAVGLIDTAAALHRVDLRRGHQRRPDKVLEEEELIVGLRPLPPAAVPVARVRPVLRGCVGHGAVGHVLHRRRVGHVLQQQLVHRRHHRHPVRRPHRLARRGDVVDGGGRLHGCARAIRVVQRRRRDLGGDDGDALSVATPGVAPQPEATSIQAPANAIASNPLTPHPQTLVAQDGQRTHDACSGVSPLPLQAAWQFGWSVSCATSDHRFARTVGLL